MKIVRPLKAARLHCLECSGTGMTRTAASQQVNSCPKQDCPLWRARLGKGTQGAVGLLRARRLYCLECCGAEPGQTGAEARRAATAVKWCTCHGPPASWCYLWPYRFGKRPGTLRGRGKGHLVDPTSMPPNNMMGEDCNKWEAEQHGPIGRWLQGGRQRTIGQAVVV